MVVSFKFGSKAEARKYIELRTRQNADEVVGFLRQVPMYLPGGVVYRMDILVFWVDGRCIGIEVKGYQTPECKIKSKQVSELYPWFELEVCQ